MESDTTSIDPFKFLHILLNSDGSLTRLDPRPSVPSILPINKTPLGFFKDVPLDEEKSTSLRLFLPLNQMPEKKLSVIIFTHGGGFILQSAAGKGFHDMCMSMASQFTAVVVSVEYRLAPEHRLPAAYEDAVDALLWVQQQALGAYVESWISRYADVSKCFLMGGSAGANIAYNAGLRALDLDLKPMKIVGLIISQPFFGGVERTQLELKLISDIVLPLAASDLMWHLALPIGSSRDHNYANPSRHGSQQGKKIKRLQRCLVRGSEGDPLVDRQREFVKMLKGYKVDVETVFREGGIHAAEVFDPTKVQVLLDDVKAFISMEKGRPNQSDEPHKNQSDGPHKNQSDGPQQHY